MRKCIIGPVRAEVLRSFVRLHCADGTQLTRPPSVLLLQRQSQVTKVERTQKCTLCCLKALLRVVCFFFFTKLYRLHLLNGLKIVFSYFCWWVFWELVCEKNIEGSQTTKWTLKLTHIRSFGEGVLCSDFSLMMAGVFSSPPPACCERLQHFLFCSGTERSRYLYSKWPFVKRGGEAITG